MSDLISRQAAIDALAKCVPYAICDESTESYMNGLTDAYNLICQLPSAQPVHWIPCSERLPETDNKNSINNYNVLLWVKDKSHPEREPQIYLGKLRHIDGDDGSGNFWGVKTHPCDWTIWGWSYFNEPEVIAWMPLPEPYREERTEE